MSYNSKVVAFRRSPSYVHHRAMMNRRENNMLDALELLRQAVEAQPENQDYRLDLAQLYGEMGCYEQSNRLVLDLLAQGGPSDCYYQLAMNQLGMNDIFGARKSLSLYRLNNPLSDFSEDTTRIAMELSVWREPERSRNRKLNRALRIAEHAAEAMNADQPERACRLYARSLDLAPRQSETRAMYALSLLNLDRPEDARAEALRAAAENPASVWAICVCAQVHWLLGDEDTAKRLVRHAAAERPSGQDLRLLIYAMGEMGLDADVARHARRARLDAPFDRDLLHIQAVALGRLGVPQHRLARFWARILRIDPEDSVAQFYQQAALEGTLDRYGLDYSYQLPDEEYQRRAMALLEHLKQGYEHVDRSWRENAEFRGLLRWAVSAPNPRISQAAVTTLTTIDSEDSRSLLRQLLFSGEVSSDLKLRAALSLHLQGLSTEQLLPSEAGLSDGILPSAQSLLSRLSVGERQLVRYADEVLSRDYERSALSRLLAMWMTYRQSRGTWSDPLDSTEAAAAALVYTYLTIYETRPVPRELADAFGCGERRMLFYARRIARRLERISNRTPDANP